VVEPAQLPPRIVLALTTTTAKENRHGCTHSIPTKAEGLSPSAALACPDVREGGGRAAHPRTRPKALPLLSEGHHLDRLARSTRDLRNTLDTIAKAGATFRSLGDPWADSTTPHGKFMLIAVFNSLRWYRLPSREEERNASLAIVALERIELTSAGEKRARAGAPYKPFQASCRHL
jgi:hypothetical protein